MKETVLKATLALIFKNKIIDKIINSRKLFHPYSFSI